ncbi:MAG: response regulator transcription factor NblR [Cyanophyceae cyanobacterium]
MMPMASASCVLLVKTDEVWTRRARTDLEEVGYAVVAATDISQGLHQFNELHPVMVVIDYVLAGDSGLNFCRQLRNRGTRLPILMLVEQETVNERVACLESGADDYMAKPYHAKAFIQLVNFYLQPVETAKEQLRFGGLSLDLTTRRAIRGGQAIDLTMKEYELLKYLISHPREVLTREQILENVWGYNFGGESNVIEVYIRYLRLKIEQEGQKRLIHTVRGVGYVLREG